MYQKGDKVTQSNGAWWDGKAVIKTVFKKVVKLEGYKNSVPMSQIRKGHSKNWEEVQGKFGNSWYRG